MTRIAARTGQAVIDVAVLAAAYWLAFYLRFDGAIPLQMFKRFLFTWPYVVAGQYLLLVIFGIPRLAWRYVGIGDAGRIGRAIGCAAVVLLAVRLGADAMRTGYAQWAQLPFGVIAVDACAAFLGLAGVRVIRRVAGERAEKERRRDSDLPLVPTLLAGAGQAGVMVAKELLGRPDLGMRPIGFVDDDPAKRGSRVHGMPVLGITQDIEALVAAHGAQQVLITMASAPGSVVRRITRACERAGVKAKIIPGIYEIVGGQVNLSRIRSVAIEDLLGREPVELDGELIRKTVQGKHVLVTGAGGSIGSELCRQLCRFRPDRLVLLEQSENALFNIHRELIEIYPELELVPVIADICDAQRIDEVFGAHTPHVVFHAAAHKHVPMMEWNAGEAVKNNVFGTKCAAEAAQRHKAEIFVQISTDKAVNPTSVMGATKRVAEMVLQSFPEGGTRFVAVRFGNVLGSAGSVVQVFKEQIAAGGPVTVTDPEMRRYFMLIPEACQLVMQAGALAHGGEIFLLDMGEPVKIVDLAKDMIRLSGYEPDREVKIEFTGSRPGEKLYEELLLTTENHDRTVHPKILVGRFQEVPASTLAGALEQLSAVVDAPNDVVRRALGRVVPEATLGQLSVRPPPVETVPDDQPMSTVPSAAVLG